MEKNQLIKNQGIIYRILAIDADDVLLIDCIKKAMPKWFKLEEVDGYEDCTEEELQSITETALVEEQITYNKFRKLIS